jgi:predicted RNase H-like HicB family nuclease
LWRTTAFSDRLNLKGEWIMQYDVVMEQEGGSFSAYVPDLPGCVAVAETEEEVRMMILEAIEFHLEGSGSEPRETSG